MSSVRKRQQNKLKAELDKAVKKSNDLYYALSQKLEILGLKDDCDDVSSITGHLTQLRSIYPAEVKEAKALLHEYVKIEEDCNYLEEHSAFFAAADRKIEEKNKAARETEKLLIDFAQFYLKPNAVGPNMSIDTFLAAVDVEEITSREDLLKYYQLVTNHLVALRSLYETQWAGYKDDAHSLDIKSIHIWAEMHKQFPQLISRPYRPALDSDHFEIVTQALIAHRKSKLLSSKEQMIYNRLVDEFIRLTNDVNQYRKSYNKLDNVKRLIKNYADEIRDVSRIRKVYKIVTLKESKEEIAAPIIPPETALPTSPSSAESSPSPKTASPTSPSSPASPLAGSKDSKESERERKRIESQERWRISKRNTHLSPKNVLLAYSAFNRKVLKKSDPSVLVPVTSKAMLVFRSGSGKD